MTPGMALGTMFQGKAVVLESLFTKAADPVASTPAAASHRVVGDVGPVVLARDRGMGQHVEVAGTGQVGHVAVVLALDDLGQHLPGGHPGARPRTRREGSVTTRSASAPTDWYMLPISVLSGSLTGAWFQFTVVRLGSSLAIGSSVASL